VRQYNISKEYNWEIATKKTKVFGFFGTDHLKAKTIINDETLEQVSQFTCLGCSISYQFSNDVEFKLAKLLQLIGTIKRTRVHFTLYFFYILLFSRRTYCHSVGHPAASDNYTEII